MELCDSCKIDVSQSKSVKCGLTYGDNTAPEKQMELSVCSNCCYHMINSHLHGGVIVNLSKITPNQDILNQMLYMAIKNDDPSSASYVIRLGANVNHIIPDMIRSEWPPSGHLLHIAVNKHNLEIIKLLLIHGADPNTLNNCGETPLNFILWYILPYEQMYQIASQLLDYGADPNLPNQHGGCALDMPINRIVDRTYTKEQCINLAQLFVAYGAYQCQSYQRLASYLPSDCKEFFHSLRKESSKKHDRPHSPNEYESANKKHK